MSKNVLADGDKPVAFVSVSDRIRAKDFYAGKLGLKVVYEDDFALVLDLGVTSLRITEVKAFQPQAFTILGWEVTDIVSSAKQLKSFSIEAKRYDGMEQDEFGIWRPPGSSSRVMWFEDPDGNLLSLSD